MCTFFLFKETQRGSNKKDKKVPRLHRLIKPLTKIKKQIMHFQCQFLNPKVNFI